MRFRIFGLVAIVAFVVACFLGSASAQAQFAQQGPKLVGTYILGAYAAQGASVALSADGNTAVVSGIDNSSGVGAVWVFMRVGGMWSQQAQLAGSGGIGSLGGPVALSADGNTVIVGDAADDSGVGAAWVFTRAGDVWNQQAKLVATDALGPYMLQGYSVALSSDGNTAIGTVKLTESRLGGS